MTTEEINLVEAARHVLKAAGYYVDQLWHVDDLHFLCEQLEQDQLAPGEAEQVFNIASQHFDGESGISWPQLERALQLFRHRKQALQDLVPKPKMENLW